MCYSFLEKMSAKRRRDEESDGLPDPASGVSCAGLSDENSGATHQDSSSRPKRRKLDPDGVIADSNSELSSPPNATDRGSQVAKLADQVAAYDGEADDEKGAIIEPARTSRSTNAARYGEAAELKDSSSTSDLEVLVEDSQAADRKSGKASGRESMLSTDALDDSFDSGVASSMKRGAEEIYNVGAAKIKNEDEDKDSDLSDVVATPPPPTQELRELERHHEFHKVECTHTSWCKCPMHASHEFDIGYRHLSEWALSGMELVESAERNTHSKLTKLESEDKTRRKDVNRVSKSIIANLVELQSYNDDDPSRLPHAAHVMVEQINIAFYNTRASGHALQQVLELFDRALKAWKKTGDFQKLKTGFAIAVKGNKDLMFKFQQFLPEEYRIIKIEEVRIRKMKPSEVKRRTSLRGRELKVKGKLHD